MKADQLFARAIYASGTPLNIADDDNWRSFPSWEIPSRYKLSTVFLEAEFNSIKQKVGSKILESQSLGLMCDGLTNIRGKPIINYVITTHSPVFL